MNLFQAIIVFNIWSVLFLTKSVYAQNVIINEIMAANAVTILDEDGDSPDWIELYNPGSAPLNLIGYGLSDDATEPFKWVFPAIQLAPHAFLLIFASDKDRRDWCYWETVIDWGDNWKYRLGYSEPSSDWRTINFDDSNWQQGASGFGYGDNDDATIIPQIISIYLRKSFNVENLNNITRALLHVDYDDAFVAYLNNVEIARANIGQPGDIPTFDQFADNYREAEIYQGGLPELYIVEDIQSLFQPGKNILAIQAHNFGVYSSDFSIIPFFTLVLNNPPSDTSRGISKFLQLLQPNLHTNFKIKSSGETISLYNVQGKLVDQVETKRLPVDISFGRKPDGSTQWNYFELPTPGEANNSRGYIKIGEAPIFTHPGGFYTQGFYLTIVSHLSTASIYYTLDGSEPTINSNLYSSPFEISKTTVVRAREFVPGYLPGPIVTNTYFVDENISLPIVSLSTNPANLWDEDMGIYVMGKNAETNFPYFGANFWEDWERPVYMEFYEPDGTRGFSLDAGMKIFGGWSRGYAQKSLSIFARARYGTDVINYQIFPDKPVDQFKSIILRNSGNDWISTLFRDGMMHSLVKETDLDLQAYRPAILFLNGEYWGIHNIREKMNEDYLEFNRGVDPDNVDILENSGIVIEGDATHYEAMIDYIATHNMKLKATYDSVKAMMHVDNFIDYVVTQIYYDNTDWPGNNIKFWRPRIPGGKWKWLMFDTDFGFGLFDLEGYKHNTLEFATEDNGPEWPNPPWSTFLLRKLLENKTFKYDFINRLADFMNTCFQPSKVNQIIDELTTILKPEIPRHQERWSGSPYNWNQNVQVLKQFADYRIAYIKGHLLHKFQLEGLAEITLNISQPNWGKIKINSLTISQFPWNGYYFKNIPIRLTAIANTGYRFSNWSDSTMVDSSTVVYYPTQNTMITAIFQDFGATGNSIVINEINYNSASDFDPEDWIELYNNTKSAIDISGWMFKDEDESHVFTFPAQTIMNAKGFLVLCRNKEVFSNLFPTVQSCYGDFNFGLSGSGELIRIYDDQGWIVDSLRYDVVSPWPTEPDGDGPTLELRDPSLDNCLANSWAASIKKGGTPGSKNSIITQLKESASIIKEFQLAQNYPNPFNSTTTIYYCLPKDCFVTITVFNIRGQAVAKLVDDHRQAGRHQIEWKKKQIDKTTGVALSSGVYFYKIEAVYADDSFKDVKKMLYLK